MTTTLPLPRKAGDLSPEYLTRLLGLPSGIEVVGVRIRDSFQGAASRVRLELEYSEPEVGLPTAMFLKTVIETSDDIDATLTAIRAGAGPGMYATEVRFYEEIRPHLSAETPAVYASQYYPEDARFLVLMEDLLARSARFPTEGDPLTVAEAGSVLDTLARLHADYWDSPRFAADLAWIDSPHEGHFITFVREAGPAMFETESGMDFKLPFVHAAGVDGPGLFEAFWRLQDINQAATPTLLHGDPHFANLYVLPEGVCGLLDWALLRRGSWAHDVSYFLAGALPVAGRREHERDLLASYLDALARHGADAPDFDTALLAYQQNMLWGFLIWMLTPAPIHPPERISANLERFAAALADHDVMAKLAV